MYRSSHAICKAQSPENTTTGAFQIESLNKPKINARPADIDSNRAVLEQCCPDLLKGDSAPRSAVCKPESLLNAQF